jgi:hypothetical protein
MLPRRFFNTDRPLPSSSDLPVCRVYRLKCRLLYIKRHYSGCRLRLTLRRLVADESHQAMAATHSDVCCLLCDDFSTRRIPNTQPCGPPAAAHVESSHKASCPRRGGAPNGNHPGTWPSAGGSSEKSCIFTDDPSMESPYPDDRDR